MKPSRRFRPPAVYKHESQADNGILSSYNLTSNNRGLKDITNTRVLQTMFSGIPLVLGPRTSM